jgi:hypothetical protein
MHPLTGVLLLPLVCGGASQAREEGNAAHWTDYVDAFYISRAPRILRLD